MTTETKPSAAARAAPQHESRPDDSPQFLRLTVGGEPFAVPLTAVREILQVGSMTPLPLTPRFVRGVMNLRGAVVPVLDLNARLGRSATVQSARSCIVIVETRADEESDARLSIGLFVDAVQEVLAIPESEIKPVPSLGTTVPAEFLSGVARVRSHLVPVLALAQALDVGSLAQLISGPDRNMH